MRVFSAVAACCNALLLCKADLLLLLLLLLLPPVLGPMSCMQRHHCAAYRASRAVNCSARPNIAITGRLHCRIVAIYTFLYFCKNGFSVFFIFLNSFFICNKR